MKNLVGRYFRQVKTGEIVEDGDEEWSDDYYWNENLVIAPYWRPVAVEFIGETVQENDPPVRRKR